MGSGVSGQLRSRCRAPMRVSRPSTLFSNVSRATCRTAMHKNNNMNSSARVVGVQPLGCSARVSRPRRNARPKVSSSLRLLFPTPSFPRRRHPKAKSHAQPHHPQRRSRPLRSIRTRNPSHLPRRRSQDLTPRRELESSQRIRRQNPRATAARRIADNRPAASAPIGRSRPATLNPRLELCGCHGPLDAGRNAPPNSSRNRRTPGHLPSLPLPAKRPLHKMRLRVCRTQSTDQQACACDGEMP